MKSIEYSGLFMHTANLHFYDRSRKKFYIDFKLCWWTNDLKLLSVAWVKQIYLKIICKTPMRNKCFNYLHFFLQSPSPSRVDHTCPLEEEIKLLNLFIQKIFQYLYSTITLVLAISIFPFLFPWIDKSKIQSCGDFSNILKKFAMKSFSLILISSICGKSENFAMTQLPGGQSCHQVIYWAS